MTEVLLTVLAACLALSQPVPQIIRLVRTKSVVGVSGPTTWLGLAINAGWMAFGVARGLVPVAVLSFAYVVGYAAIAALLVRGGNRRGTVTALGSAVAMVATATLFGWTVLGTALALTVGAQFVPQVVLAWRSIDLTALSTGTYVVCGLDGVVWGSYGVLTREAPLVLYGIVMSSVAVLVLVPKRRWTLRTAAAAAA
ncbi:PQ-loop domain-containing transporter [Actinospongicola halichondriae]|uniref:PQ-loop domain-containing transporter n=1 Tax=Actinospongicola halichondriae TaxID=3236844 RepID=UPI003D4A6212